MLLNERQNFNLDDFVVFMGTNHKAKSPLKVGSTYEITNILLLGGFLFIGFKGEPTYYNSKNFCTPEEWIDADIQITNLLGQD